MPEISENQELQMTNVLSMRKKLTVQDCQQEMERINRFIENNGLRRVGPPASATYAVEVDKGQQIMDLEILIPLDRPFDPPEGCIYKPVFQLENAVSIRHIGNPTTLQDTCDTMMAYIQEHNLQAITAGYNVTIQEPKTAAELNQMIVDIYVGVSTNS